MIDLYTWSTPNGRKVSIMLEECGLQYAAHPIDISKDEQFKPEFLKISPNNRIPAIIDRDNGQLAVRVRRHPDVPRREDRQVLAEGGPTAHWQTMEWLMWQMGGVGPMLGQVHHFVKYNKGKAPYAEERYLKEAHRLYGVLDRRLAQARISGRRAIRSPTWRPGPGSRASSGRPSISTSIPTCCAGTRRSRRARRSQKGYHVPVKQPGIPMPA